MGVEDGKREEKRGVGSGRATATGARLAHSATVPVGAGRCVRHRTTQAPLQLPVPPVFCNVIVPIHCVFCSRRRCAQRAAPSTIDAPSGPPLALLTPGGAHEPTFLMSRSHRPGSYCNLAFQTMYPAYDRRSLSHHPGTENAARRLHHLPHMAGPRGCGLQPVRVRPFTRAPDRASLRPLSAVPLVDRSLHALSRPTCSLHAPSQNIFASPAPGQWPAPSLLRRHGGQMLSSLSVSHPSCPSRPRSHIHV